MFRMYKLCTTHGKHLINSSHLRTYKNFGHKRQPEPLFTVLWHGFLTFTFIGAAIEWKWMKDIIFGGDEIKDTETPE